MSATKKLGFWLVFCIVYADIGTSVFYVPGLLWASIGDLATLAQLLTLGVFVAIARKYVSISARCPDGGGVVSITKQAFPKLGTVSLVGGAMITIDYFLTSALSGVSGINYLRSYLQFAEGWVVPLTVLILGMLLLLNIVGLKESATVTMVMAVIQLCVNTAIVIIASSQITLRHGWGDFLQHILHPGHGKPITAGALLIGYADTWLAYSGLESGAQISGAMKMPVRRTASIGMWIVVGTISVLSPLLTGFSTYVLPQQTKAEHLDAFISHLALAVGGQTLMVLTVISAALLLTMACNTAIVGNYHVNLRLVDAGFLPPMMAKRNLRFGTPHYSVAFSAIVPMLIIIAVLGNVERLGDLYSFGLLGTLTLSSLSIDVLRYREKRRNAEFFIGTVTTAALALAWFINMVFKWQALAFGGTLSLIFVVLALSYRSGTLAKLSPALAPRPSVQPLTPEQIEAMASAKPQAARVLTLDEAVELRSLEGSKVLVAIRGANDRLLQDATVVTKGLGHNNVYVCYVDEVPGLFYMPVEGPSEAANRYLAESAATMAKLGMNAIPIWRISNDAAEAIADAATKLDVEAVLVGTSKRSALWHLLRGHVLEGLARALPEKVRLFICN